MAVDTFNIIRFGIILLALLQFMSTPVRPGNYTQFWNLVSAGAIFFMLTFIDIQLTDAQLGWDIFLTEGTPGSNPRIFSILQDAVIKSAMLTIGSAVTALMINKIILTRIDKS